jgi:predicted AAA+ superfamily ATPase
MLKKRYLTPFVQEDLQEKMVFIGGPRQVGKTTLSTELLIEYYPKVGYFNWDHQQDRKRIRASEWPSDAELIILDEIHKAPKWKTLVKGNYDKWKNSYKFLVTGSARLDLYRKGGDSLQGRYHYYRLHPFTLAELNDLSNTLVPFQELPIAQTNFSDNFETLYQFGGFPEPLIKQDARHLRRWHREKVERLFREDIRELEPIRDMQSMQLLRDLLPDRVGSLLSLNALREDLEVSHRAVTHWMKILESFYYHFRISPYMHRRIRSLKKETKLYLWDWSELDDEGARFENCIASHLLKLVHFLQDHGGYQAQLHYLRDRDKREVDFLVTIDGKPWFACEAKVAGQQVAPSLRYFADRLQIPFVYQVHKNGTDDYQSNGVRVLPAHKFLASLI